MKKRNPTRAQRELMASQQALLDKWAAVPRFARGGAARPSQSTIPALTTPPGRSTGREYASLDTGGGGGTRPLHTMKYTGTKLLGIGTMHKSNSVPVFSQDEAIEIATMRRG